MMRSIDMNVLFFFLMRCGVSVSSLFSDGLVSCFPMLGRRKSACGERPNVRENNRNVSFHHVVRCHVYFLISILPQIWYLWESNSAQFGNSFHHSLNYYYYYHNFYIYIPHTSQFTKALPTIPTTTLHPTATTMIPLPPPAAAAGKEALMPAPS